jgi:hypothetical protein
MHATPRGSAAIVAPSRQLASARTHGKCLAASRARTHHQNFPRRDVALEPERTYSIFHPHPSASRAQAVATALKCAYSAHASRRPRPPCQTPRCLDSSGGRKRWCRRRKHGDALKTAWPTREAAWRRSLMIKRLRERFLARQDNEPLSSRTMLLPRPSHVSAVPNYN